MAAFNPAGPVLPAGVDYKLPAANVLPVTADNLVPGQMYHIWGVDPNNRGGLVGMVGTFWRLFLNFYVFNYEGVLSSQNILVSRDWRPLYAGEGPNPVSIRIRDDAVDDYLYYPINAQDIDDANAAMNQNGGRRRLRRNRRTRRARRSRRRTSKNNRR